jgi:hypothetical protein
MLDNAKTLRSNQTEAEQRLWYHLRAHRLIGLKFKRQLEGVLEQIRCTLVGGGVSKMSHGQIGSKKNEALH